MIPEALSAFAALVKAGEALAAAKSAAERNAALVEFQKLLIAAQGITLSLQASNLSLSQAHQKLEDEVRSLKDWSAEAEKYELVEVARGVFCRVYKTSVQPPESMQKYCATCFDTGEKSLLQQQSIPVGRLLCLVCGRCKLRLEFRSYLTE